jgi:hypothetical protein
MEEGMHPKRMLLVTAVVLLSVLCPPSHAEIPQVISYQGKVTDMGGIPIADGDYSITFTLYDAATSGTSLWSSGALMISVSGGVFSVLLGDTGQPVLDLDFDVDYWLEIDIAGDLQSPRQQLGSVGYAYMASGLVPGTEVSGTVSSGANAAIKGTNTDTTGSTYGIRGDTHSTSGRAVYGLAHATTGLTMGIYGESVSTLGRGVYGSASATTGSTIGVIGVSVSQNGTGLYGEVTASAGTTYGVLGQSASTSGYGVHGKATASTGTTSGVWGESASTYGTGVLGTTSTTTGVTYGVRGDCSSTDGVGVSGYSPHCGVLGYSTSTDGTGVFGQTTATTGATHGVRGINGSASGFGVYYTGNLGGTGSKSCIVKTSQGPTHLYCQESPENWFEDFGESRLVRGHAHIDLDPLFLETVTINEANPMKVFIQLLDECNGTRVVRGQTGFDVIELHDGESDAAFMYRVVAKRKGFEEKRLDFCEAGLTDSYLYPELREKELELPEE